LNKHPFTIVGVAQPAFHGTIVFFNPDFFVPLVDQEQIDGENDLEARGVHSVFEVMGHLKPGVTPAMAAADLSAIGADLAKAYPKDDSHMTFTLARPGWYGDYLGPPVHAFLTGLMMLAGLILVAACANLGSLYAARAVDRSREVALRLALGSSRSRVLRQLFTEAMLISLAGGAIGLLGSIVLLRGLSQWRPLPMFPIHVPLDPDASVYVVAVLLTVVSGLFFGAVPLKQMLRTNPYEVIKSGSTAGAGRRITIRDVLLVGQVAICAVLVTSSMVAVRGLERSLHGHYGFDAKNVTFVETDLTMSGYHGDQIPALQRRMLDAVERIPGITAVGMVDKMPLGSEGGDRAIIFSDTTTELTSANASASAMVYRASPEYLHAAGTSLLAGRMLSWLDDSTTPRVAVVNELFARKFFGSVANAVGRYYKVRDGTRVQVVGVVEDGKYEILTEDPRPAMFFPFMQSPSPSTFLIVRSERDADQLASVLRNTLRGVDPSLPLAIRTWYADLDNAFFPAHMAALALGVLGLMGAVLSITGIFGMAAHSVSRRLKELGIRIAIGAQRREVLHAALGRAVNVLAIGSATGLLFGVLASRVLAFIVYQATPRDPLVLGGVVLAMLLLGLLATWIPAQRALSVDPLILLREQ
jgi:predicted permease